MTSWMGRSENWPSMGWGGQARVCIDPWGQLTASVLSSITCRAEGTTDCECLGVWSTEWGQEMGVVLVVCERPALDLQYIDAELPPESPYLYGLHPNAEIGFLTQTSEKLFRTVLELQPQDSHVGDGAAATREEKVGGGGARGHSGT